jgi:hypothetical protein
LRDPVTAQGKLAFSGPDGEHRKQVFDLKTAAALAVGAYLVTAEVRLLLHPHEVRTAPRSALAPLPSEIVIHENVATRS